MCSSDLLLSYNKPLLVHEFLFVFPNEQFHLVFSFHLSLSFFQAPHSAGDEEYHFHRLQVASSTIYTRPGTRQIITSRIVDSKTPVTISEFRSEQKARGCEVILGCSQPQALYRASEVPLHFPPFLFLDRSL